MHSHRLSYAPEDPVREAGEDIKHVGFSLLFP